MEIHRMYAHPNEEKIRWRFNVVKKIPWAMFRQIAEAIIIRREEMKEGVEILNNKN